AIRAVAQRVGRSEQRDGAGAERVREVQRAGVAGDEEPGASAQMGDRRRGERRQSAPFGKETREPLRPCFVAGTPGNDRREAAPLEYPGGERRETLLTPRLLGPTCARMVERERPRLSGEKRVGFRRCHA